MDLIQLQEELRAVTGHKTIETAMEDMEKKAGILSYTVAVSRENIKQDGIDRTAMELMVATSKSILSGLKLLDTMNVNAEEALRMAVNDLRARKG